MGSSSTPPSYPAFLAKTELGLLKHFNWKFQIKNKTPWSQKAAAPYLRRLWGQGQPPVTLPPAPHTYALLQASASKCQRCQHVHTAGGDPPFAGQRQYFGVQEAWTGSAQQGEGFTPRMDAAMGTQLLWEAVASWQGW